MKMYTYKDFAEGTEHKTRGSFCGWTTEATTVGVRYAIFCNRVSTLYVPEYCLTQETRERIKAAGAW